MEILPMLMPQIFIDQFVFVFKVVNNVPWCQVNSN
jgi:hypothetical protein